MTDEQYQRWKDFALRMAKTCFIGSRRPTSRWIVKQVASWFWWRDYQEDWGDYNSWDGGKYPLSEHVFMFFESEVPSFRCKACRHDDCRHRHPYYENYCPICDRGCQCDKIEYLANEQFETQWLGPIHCCLRAGIDMACKPSSGVIGFTAGHVRRMYPEGVPEWVFPADENLVGWLTGEETQKFSELPDSAGIVL